MIVECAFPIVYGFSYNENGDEFFKPHLSGNIIIWSLSYKGREIWELSYVDEEDYQHFLGKGTKEDIISKLRIFTRDSKIDEILG